MSAPQSTRASVSVARRARKRLRDLRQCVPLAIARTVRVKSDRVGIDGAEEKCPAHLARKASEQAGRQTETRRLAEHEQERPPHPQPVHGIETGGRTARITATPCRNPSPNAVTVMRPVAPLRVVEIDCKRLHCCIYRKLGYSCAKLRG